MNHREGPRQDRGPDWPEPGRYCHRIIDQQSCSINSYGFTLIELLVVIAIIALLLAIFIPVTRTARERGQRTVCLSNLRQLTLAWMAYADEHDSRLVLGPAFNKGISGALRLESWLGRAFLYPESRSAVMENPDKGALWPYIRNIDAYRCPRGWAGHAATYTTVAAANGIRVEGTYVRGGIGGSEMTDFGERVGSTVLRLTRMTDIVSPGPAERAVFLDQGHTPGGEDFYVHYLYPKWYGASTPPLHHAEGATLSMADGHAEYWKWKGRETIAGLPRKLFPAGSLFTEGLEGGDFSPQTDDGLYDLQRLQRATWGRLGYPVEEGP
jgi:prepilin-type N-terminal cleavage/methylation domain-containing protein/prepilin-type processing-associated H-X9-DG protein